MLLHCAHSLASAHDPSDVWLICPADGAFDRPGLLLGGATRADDAAFARVKVHTCDGHAALVKLLAATHLLPAAEVPAALVLDDGDLALLAPAAAAHARTQERALAFGATPRTVLAPSPLAFVHGARSVEVVGDGAVGAGMALLQSTLQDWRKRTGRVTQLVVGLPQAPEFMLFVALRCAASACGCVRRACACSCTCVVHQETGASVLSPR